MAWGTVKDQYESHPYPPIHWAKLPQAQQLLNLGLERYLDDPRQARGAKILILGCGTLEPLLVAEQNRHASQITAVDLSSRSLEVLRKRERLYRIATVLRKRPPIELVCADFMEWGDRTTSQWDYVIASNVLHHLPDPARGIARCAEFLRPGGILRMVTYPKLSRIWMRAGTDRFRAHGITGTERDLRARCAQVILTLPQSHPIRSAYRGSTEILTRTGLVDAYFHTQEQPLSPLEWAAAAHSAGLSLHGEWPAPGHQSDSSRTVDEWIPEILDSPARGEPWFPLWKLDLMDALLELGSNPVLTWIKRKSGATAPPVLPPTQSPRGVGELKFAAARARHLLALPGILTRPVSLEVLLERTRAQSAPARYPGMRLQDYTASELD